MIESGLQMRKDARDRAEGRRTSITKAGRRFMRRAKGGKGR